VRIPTAFALTVAVTAGVVVAVPREPETREPESREESKPADPPTTAQPRDGDRDALAQQGRYIVNHVAMCIYCHTPHNADGSLDRQQLLRGAAMPVASPYSAQKWAFKAPAIAGLPGGWSEEDVIRFLKTGETPGGYPPKLPMPPFRMNQRDAESVAAYLKSLR